MFNLFHRHKRQAVEVVVVLEEEIICIEDTHWKRHHPHRANKTDLVLSSIIYNHLTIKNSIIMSIAINVNEYVVGTLGLLDHVTQALVTDATFANQVNTSSDNAIATVDGAGKVIGVAGGTGIITWNADVTYTNSLGVKVTEPKSLIVGFTVTAVAVANGTELVVSFTAPAPVV